MQNEAVPSLQMKGLHLRGSAQNVSSPRKDEQVSGTSSAEREGGASKIMEKTREYLSKQASPAWKQKHGRRNNITLRSHRDITPREKRLKSRFSFEEVELKADSAYVNMGDEESDFYTAEAKAKRRRLRFDPSIRAVARSLFYLASGDANAVDLSKKEYIKLSLSMQKVLFKPFDVVSAVAIANEDWRRDCGERMRMPKKRFVDSMFELADLWTDSLEPHKYVTFLSKLLDCVSESYKKDDMQAVESIEVDPRKYETDGGYVSKDGVTHPSRLRGRRGSYYGTYTPDCPENTDLDAKRRSVSSKHSREESYDSGSTSSYVGASRVSIGAGDELECARIAALKASKSRSISNASFHSDASQATRSHRSVSEADALELAKNLAAKWEKQLGGAEHHRSFLMNMDPGRGRHGSWGSRRSSNVSNISSNVKMADEVLDENLAESSVGTPKLSIMLRKRPRVASLDPITAPPQLSNSFSISPGNSFSSGRSSPNSTTHDNTTSRSYSALLREQGVRRSSDGRKISMTSMDASSRMLRRPSTSESPPRASNSRSYSVRTTRRRRNSQKGTSGIGVVLPPIDNARRASAVEPKLYAFGQTGRTTIHTLRPRALTPPAPRTHSFSHAPDSKFSSNRRMAAKATRMRRRQSSSGSISGCLISTALS